MQHFSRTSDSSWERSRQGGCQYWVMTMHTRMLWVEYKWGSWVSAQSLTSSPQYVQVTQTGSEKSERPPLACPEEARCHILEHKEVKPANNCREIENGSFPRQASGQNAARPTLELQACEALSRGPSWNMPRFLTHGDSKNINVWVILWNHF